MVDEEAAGFKRPLTISALASPLRDSARTAALSPEGRGIQKKPPMKLFLQRRVGFKTASNETLSRGGEGLKTASDETLSPIGGEGRVRGFLLRRSALAAMFDDCTRSTRSARTAANAWQAYRTHTMKGLPV